jgi:hypothetical protein
MRAQDLTNLERAAPTAYGIRFSTALNCLTTSRMQARGVVLASAPLAPRLILGPYVAHLKHSAQDVTGVLAARTWGANEARALLVS